MSNKFKKPKYYNLKKDNNDDKTCVLKFSQCDDKHPLYELNKEELKSFVNFAKKVEKMPWRTIKTYNGLKFELLESIVKPDSIDKDILLSSMRVSQKFRLIGYRQDEFFYIVWFDHNHEEC